MPEAARRSAVSARAQQAKVSAVSGALPRRLPPLARGRDWLAAGIGAGLCLGAAESLAPPAPARGAAADPGPGPRRRPTRRREPPSCSRWPSWRASRAGVPATRRSRPGPSASSCCSRPCLGCWPSCQRPAARSRASSPEPATAVLVGALAAWTGRPSRGRGAADLGSAALGRRGAAGCRGRGDSRRRSRRAGSRRLPRPGRARPGPRPPGDPGGRGWRSPQDRGALAAGPRGAGAGGAGGGDCPGAAAPALAPDGAAHDRPRRLASPTSCSSTSAPSPPARGQPCARAGPPLRRPWRRT